MYGMKNTQEILNNSTQDEKYKKLLYNRVCDLGFKKGKLYYGSSKYR